MERADQETEAALLVASGARAGVARDLGAGGETKKSVDIRQRKPGLGVDEDGPAHQAANQDVAHNPPWSVPGAVELPAAFPRAPLGAHVR